MRLARGIVVDTALGLIRVGVPLPAIALDNRAVASIASNCRCVSPRVGDSAGTFAGPPTEVAARHRLGELEHLVGAERLDPRRDLLSPGGRGGLWRLCHEVLLGVRMPV